jgi:hypothetical protein
VLAIDDRYHLDVNIVRDYERLAIQVDVVVAGEFDFTTLDRTPDHPYAFFVVPDDSETLNQLQEIFGNRLTGPEWSP